MTSTILSLILFHQPLEVVALVSVKYKFLLVWRVGLKGFEVEEEDGCNLLRQHWHSLFEGVPVVR